MGYKHGDQTKCLCSSLSCLQFHPINDYDSQSFVELKKEKGEKYNYKDLDMNEPNSQLSKYHLVRPQINDPMETVAYLILEDLL